MLPQTNQMPQKVPLRFTVDEYYKLIDLGMLHDYEKAEIIEGELIRNMPIGDRDASVVNKLNKILIKNVSDDILVSIQNPLRLSDYNEPEPDVVLADLNKYDGKRHPQPKETLAVIEVSDSTLKYDRDTKLLLYAEAEIPEVWIVNLPKNIIEVHQKPSDGLYQITKLFKLGESVKSEIILDLEIEVDKILGE
ncbi:MAG: Uma2 family endonuclease [Acidobacteriota bacterium]